MAALNFDPSSVPPHFPYADLPIALEHLKGFPNWVLWRLEMVDGQLKKMPYQPKRPSSKAKTNDKNTWGLYDVARAAFLANPGEFDGLGFVLNGTPFAAFDCDNCVIWDRDEGTFRILPKGRRLLKSCRSYAELTPSLTGFRIIGRALGPADAAGPAPVDDELPWKIEIYRSNARYITITGCTLDGFDLELENIDKEIDTELDAVRRLTPKGNGKGNGHDHSPPRDFTAHEFAEGEDIEDALDFRLLDIIRNGVSDSKDRSAIFQGVVNACYDAGLSAAQTYEVLAKHPAGIAAKYRGRLETEVKRSWDKAATYVKPNGESEPYDFDPETGEIFGETPQAEAPADRENFKVSEWLKLDLPPRDYLTGEVMCTTSRWLIFGETGVGKNSLCAFPRRSHRHGRAIPGLGRPSPFARHVSRRRNAY